MSTLIRVMSPILNLLLYITLILMALTWTATHYPINISSIIGIWATNCLITPMEAELMDRCRRMREGHDSLCLRAFPKKNPILTHYMLSKK